MAVLSTEQATILCPRCQGNREISVLLPRMRDGDPMGYESEVCPECRGQGRVTYEPDYEPDYDPERWNPAEGGNKASDDYW